MIHILRPETIAQNPHALAETITLSSGETALFRPVQAGDAEELGRYFEGLSEATRHCFSPHPFTMEQARQLCAEIDYTQMLRLIALTQKQVYSLVIAYFLLQLGVSEGTQKRYQDHGLPLDPRQDCTFAPSVADAYQNHGLGSALMPKVLHLARQLGFQRMVLMGGTRAANHRAIHFYEKFGFRKVGDFTITRPEEGVIGNHDMILPLA